MSNLIVRILLRARGWALLLVGLALLTGCAVLRPAPATPTAVAPTNTPVVIVVTATRPAAANPTATLPLVQPTAVLFTAVPPTATQTNAPPPPTATSPASTLPPPATATRTNPATLRLQMYLVAIDDNGASGSMIGCGDSLIPVNIDVPYTQGVLRAALERLLAQKDQFYGESGLYNALYQSDLRLEDVAVRNGDAVIELGGQVRLGGTCDTPRVIGQLEATALQFSTVRRVTLTLNGRPIQEALSER